MDSCSVFGCMQCDVQVLGCWILFCAANVAKALLAKKMASHFHKQTHFQKMRDAIKKVRHFCLHAQTVVRLWHHADW